MQIHLEAGTARYYPFSSLAANVIGVAGTDGGLTGLEYQYNSFLLGESGKYITSKDAQGGQMPSKYDTYIDASNGANLVTTIDVTIQKALEKQLKQSYLEFRAGVEPYYRNRHGRQHRRCPCNGDLPDL